jgi:hypothetical protein
MDPLFCEINSTYTVISPFAEKMKENHVVLQEATIYRMEGCRKDNSHPQVTGVKVTMLADLQELQDLEVETYIQQMPDMVSIGKVA